MLRKHNSNMENAASVDALPDAHRGMALPPIRQISLILLMTFFALLFGLVLGRATFIQPLVGLLLSATVVVFFIGSDLNKGWLLLFLASNLSAIRIDSGSLTIRPDQAVLGWLLIIFFFTVMVNKIRLNRLPLAFPLLGLLTINIFASYMNAPDKGFSYQSCALLAYYMLMYYITYQVLSQNRMLLRKSPLIFVGIGVIQAVYGLIALIGKMGGANIAGAYSTGSGIGLTLSAGFQEANIFGAVMAVVAIVLMAHITIRSHWHQGKRLYLIFTLVVIALLLSFTRAAWLGFAFGMISLLVVLIPPRNIFNPRALALLFTMALMFFVVLIPIGNQAAEISGGEEDAVTERVEDIIDFSEGSGLGRKELQTQAMEKWRTNPIIGNGTYSLQKVQGGRTVGTFLYSSLIQSLHDTGLVGLFFMVWIYLGGLVIAFRGYKRCATRFWKATIAGAGLGWISLTISSQASSLIWLSVPWIYLGMLMAWSLHGPELEAVKIDESDQPKTGHSPAMGYT